MYFKYLKGIWESKRKCERIDEADKSLLSDYTEAKFLLILILGKRQLKSSKSFLMFSIQYQISEWAFYSVYPPVFFLKMLLFFFYEQPNENILFLRKRQYHAFLLIASSICSMQISSWLCWKHISNHQLVSVLQSENTISWYWSSRNGIVQKQS